MSTRKYVQWYEVVIAEHNETIKELLEKIEVYEEALKDADLFGVRMARLAQAMTKRKITDPQLKIVADRVSKRQNLKYDGPTREECDKRTRKQGQ